MVTPQDVQKQLDNAVAHMKQTTITLANFIKVHGSDWTKWPKTSNWYMVMNAISTARKEAGQLVAQDLTADFSVKYA